MAGKTPPAVKTIAGDLERRSAFMPMNSVNTNVSAMLGLENLNATQMDLSTTQSRTNTRLKVAWAKDNGAIWPIAQNQRAPSQSLNSVKDSLQRSSSTVDVALAAGESIS